MTTEQTPTNRRHLSLFAGLLLGASFMFSVTAPAEEAAAPPETPAPPAGNLASEYTEKGADTCIKCHDEDSEFPVFSIFKTKHAQRADKRTPFAGLQCETCHGPGANHAKKVRPGEKQAPIIAFGPRSKLAPDKINPVPVAEQNRICLNCHRGDARIGWNASAHDSNDVACVRCHKIHAARDAVLATATQAEVCEKCHLKERADFHKPSVHPVRFGQMACSECHNPHGANTDALLAQPTVNQTCYTCHAEKRGPFLWEHAPVTEDCTLCHTPHGSIYPALLKKNLPLLCQQCHTVAGHPSVARTADSLPGGVGGPSEFLLAGSCTNCHSQVHGSNSPSGVKLMR
ncbi:MAG TPA: DmsE family decaheme c-type cytochrome [Candidatus Methylomirabilis sp.]|nr:DmsE family decaheme c-type cytochrome [Candidatus Methylomirabilis sp.]